MIADAATGSRRGWYAVFVFLLLYMLAQIDRQVISLMVEPIRTEFSLDDGSLGLLMGPAFGICYAVMALPIAWLADRVSRRLVMFAGIALWSMAACASGLAQSFGQLFAARMLVGVGEAALLPSAYVLTAQLMPRHRLATALSVLSMGSVAGISISYGLGGWLLHAYRDGATLPLVGALAPWRMIFIVTGLPALAIALLLWFIPERPPVRADAAEWEAGEAHAVRLFPFMRRHWRACLGLLIGFGTVSLCGAALLAWIPAYMHARFGWSPARIGLSVGVMLIVIATVGKLGSGLLVDRLFARGMRDAHLRYLLGATLIAGVPTFAAFTVDNPYLFLVMLSSWFLLAFPLGGYGSACVQLMTPEVIRGRMSAMFIFVINIMATGIGPTMVGFLSERAFGGSAAGGLAYALPVTLGLWLPLALVVLWQGLGPARRAIAEQVRS